MAPYQNEIKLDQASAYPRNKAREEFILSRFFQNEAVLIQAELREARALVLAPEKDPANRAPVGFGKTCRLSWHASACAGLGALPNGIQEEHSPIIILEKMNWAQWHRVTRPDRPVETQVYQEERC